MRANFADALERIAELEQAVADHIKLQGIQFEKGVNEGMERAAEIVSKHRVSATGYSASEAIRKEIDGV